MTDTTNTHNVPVMVTCGDVSRDARSLARLADRLEKGKRHIIFLEKPPSGRGWVVKVAGVGEVD